ncbi:MAG: ATP synthase F1 subunit epsilon [Eubacteriales bacterium]|jgi:F-type H+-transporting ATPase subunit epsilon
MANNPHTFYLQVIATEKVYFKGRVSSVNVQAEDGRRQFLAHHADTTLATVPGDIEIVTEAGERISAVAGFGVIMVANNRVTMLTETCESAEELDQRRAQEALDRAKERLRQKQSMREYRMTQAAMARALSRLKFKGKHLK